MSSIWVLSRIYTWKKADEKPIITFCHSAPKWNRNSPGVEACWALQQFFLPFAIESSTATTNEACDGWLVLGYLYNYFPSCHVSSRFVFFPPLLNCLCFCCLNENRKWIQELGWHTAHNFYYFISEAVHVSWIMLSSSARSMRVSGFSGARRFLQNGTKREKSKIRRWCCCAVCRGVSTRSSKMET